MSFRGVILTYVDDGLPRQRSLATPFDEGIRAWREPGLGKIWIATRQKNDSGDGPEAFVSIELASGGDEGLASHQNPVDQRRMLSPDAGLFLNVSTTLLEGYGMAEVLSAKVLTDPVSFELALAVVEAYSFPRINEYTQRSLVIMLCAQLSEAAAALLEPVPNRSSGFEDWQRQLLETALSKVSHGESTLELFAHRCGLSVCHFARLFKAAYRMPFHQYVIQQKITRACALLSETNECLSQIALECGFSDQSSFTRRFSSKTGSSPAAWRRWSLFKAAEMLS